MSGLALDTPLATPTGWTTMGNVQVGDEVFGADGKPCNVIGKSQVHNRPCYKTVFSTTSSIVCDDTHLWRIETGHYSQKTGRLKRTETLTSNQLFQRWETGERAFTIPQAPPPRNF